jgi:hypothetical protein
MAMAIAMPVAIHPLNAASAQKNAKDAKGHKPHHNGGRQRNLANGARCDGCDQPGHCRHHPSSGPGAIDGRMFVMMIVHRFPRQ